VNGIYLGHVLAFSLAALACFVSVGRARRIEHAGTRRGLTSLLLTSGVWAGANLGYLVVPSPAAKRACYILGLVAGLVAVGAWLYFCAAYTGRSPRRLPYRRLVGGTLLVLVALKLTNPLHHLYFTASTATTPFPHLAIQHGVIHWVAIGFAYALAFVGFYMLLEHFHHAGTDTRPLAVLVGLTALPVGANVVGVTSPWLLAMTYEPIGVAAFALGVLFVYVDRFRTVHLAGEIDDPVVFLDRDDRIRDYNRIARKTFPSLSGAIGKPIETVLPEIAGRHGDAPYTVQFSHDGETRDYHVVSNPFMAGETRTGRALVVSDITETERYQRQLEQKTEQLEALNRVVRHDIRNDMTVVLGWAQALEPHVDEPGREAFDRILRSAEHTVELTEMAHEFVESLTGEQQLEREALDLRSLIEAELDAAREAYPDANIRTPEEIPPVTIRANHMVSSVFRNLLNNAVQHNDTEQPEITMRVEALDDSVTVRIADNGPGVPDERKDAIFGKGQKRIDSEGTGIGLYLVQTLVDQFAGTVHAEDNDPEGAVFVVELPRVAGDAETDSQPDRPAL
jgi:signal transduction histidine kinase